MELLQEIIDYGILFVLGVMSIAAFAVAGERWWMLRKIELRNFADRHSCEIALTKHLHLIATIGSNA